MNNCTRNLLTKLVVAGLFLIQVHRTLAYDAAAYKDPHYAEGRTTMVHLFEWKFKDIAVECEEFLGPMGFGGVQLSPINENLVIPGRPWYERYQPMSYKIITRSGNEEEFGDMVNRCNKVGVRIYVDVVLNHMTADYEEPKGTGGSTAEPSERLYPGVPYTSEHFNPPCSRDMNTSTAEYERDCDLLGMHDLNQTKEYVREKMVEFLNRAVDYGVAGFRIDAAKHMWPKDLEIIYERIKNLTSKVFGENKRPFIFQEVIDLNIHNKISKLEYSRIGAVTEFFFGIELGKFFQGMKSLKHLKYWLFRNLEPKPLPSSDSVVFIDNHDNQRKHGAGGRYVLTHKRPRLYKMAIAFMLAHDYGFPRVMSSYKFSYHKQGPPTDYGDNIVSPNPIADDMKLNAVKPCGKGWICEHRWSQIYGMVAFRNIVQNERRLNWWTNDQNQIAFSRGKRGFIAFNGQNDVDLNETLQTSLPPGLYCDIISGRMVNGKCTGKTVKVSRDSKANIEILKDEHDRVLAIHTGSKL